MCDIVLQNMISWDFESFESRNHQLANPAQSFMPWIAKFEVGTFNVIWRMKRAKRISTKIKCESMVPYQLNIWKCILFFLWNVLIKVTPLVCLFPTPVSKFPCIFANADLCSHEKICPKKSETKNPLRKISIPQLNKAAIGCTITTLHKQSPLTSCWNNLLDCYRYM